MTGVAYSYQFLTKENYNRLAEMSSYVLSVN